MTKEQNAQAQRRWKAAQQAEGRRRVELWLTEYEVGLLKSFLIDIRNDKVERQVFERWSL